MFSDSLVIRLSTKGSILYRVILFTTYPKGFLRLSNDNCSDVNLFILLEHNRALIISELTSEFNCGALTKRQSDNIYSTFSFYIFYGIPKVYIL